MGVISYALHWLTGLEIRDAKGVRYAELALALAPAAALYSALCIFWARPWAWAVTATLAVALALAQQEKLRLTTESISWFDVSSTDNLAIALVYVSAHHLIAMALLAVIAVAAYVRFRFRSKIPTKKVDQHHQPILAFGIWIPLAMHPYFIEHEIFPPNLKATLEQHADIGYMSWNWDANIKKNGLFTHLIQTSVRTVPPSPTEEQMYSLNRLEALGVKQTRPHKIVYILCEACWHDEQHFKPIFKPLTALGFKELRTVSPAYGGGTANAAFEMLTGLPAKGHLKGIIYQEYAPIIHGTADALPQRLRQSGYTTLAAHNFTRKFWQRHVVLPKIGFDAFHGIEDIGYDGKSYFPEDSVLFDFSEQLLLQYSTNPIFLHLTTVYSHGPYAVDMDDGEKDYQRKIQKTIQDIAQFAKQLQHSNRNIVILVYGDHKPALNSYFYKHGVLAEDQMEDTNTVGNVPVYLFSHDSEGLDSFIATAQSLPMFCLAQRLDKHFFQSGLPTFAFTQAHACNGPIDRAYTDRVNSVPAWLYSAMLFDRISL